MKTIDRWMFRLRGRSVPVMKVSDIEQDGRVNTLQDLGSLKDRPNSLVNSWDSKAWEKAKDSLPITFLDEKGIPQKRWIVSSKGETVNLYTRPPGENPNLEDIIGKAATIDDIAEAMDLGKSIRNLLLGVIIGAPLGWFVFQVISTAMKAHG